MDERILVKFSTAKNCVNIKTISKTQKSPHDFTVARSDFIALGRDGHMIARDMHSFAEFDKNEIGDIVTICFTWLNNDGYQYVGWKQIVSVPYDALMDFVLNGESGRSTWKVLSIEPKNSPRFVFECPAQLRTCVENKIIRRKLARFLRDHFKWWGAEKICFYSDFVAYSFFFQEFRGEAPGIAGGLIYHTGEDLSKGYYSIHT